VGVATITGEKEFVDTVAVDEKILSRFTEKWDLKQSKNFVEILISKE